MSKHKIALLLHDIRSTHNVGSILRTAECLGVKDLYFSGYTPYPLLQNDIRLPHIASKLTKQIHKTALGAEAMINCYHFESLKNAVNQAKKDGYIFVVGLEQDKNSVKLNDFRQNDNILLILGNETEGIDDWTKNSADAIIEIPQLGNKESLNVSNAAAIAIYHLTFINKNE
ncbi:MAG: TrmH family RNA methyltransferase [Patescibacteria group bacterium]|jgi:tRNA G18 (ribose-2'-O)-methylase SpoU|nr:TrmH family RNA methyltransferase [Patescibacteria group bacterium]